MRNHFKNLSLLLMALMAYSCNEKISPELQSGGSTTLPGGPSGAPDEYFFRVTNQSDVILNYVLHRTGSGNASTPCSIDASTAFSSDLFSGEGNSGIDHEQKLFDYTCYFDAEELSLFFNGVSFQVESSKNTCEYIAYQPFSFFESIPGKSVGNWYVRDCGNLSTAECNAQANLETNLSKTQAAGSNVIPDGHAVDQSGLVAAASRQSQLLTTPQQLCHFDYSSGSASGNGKNCDEGGFNITTISWTKNETTGAISRFESAEYHSCEGSVLNCIGGPIKQTKLAEKFTWGRLITKAEKDKELKIKYTLPKLMEKREANYDIVNFRRGLAAKELNFKNYDALNSTTNWDITGSEIKRFDPTLMENYAINRVWHGGGLNIVNYSDIKSFIDGLGQAAVPFAADPFLGINPDAILAGNQISTQIWSVNPTYRVSPFYVFSCLDKNSETKARIKMVIRDWDRAFPSTSSSLELISDFGNFSSSSAIEPRLQDVLLTSAEVDDDPSLGNMYNDSLDWDDLVPMTRTADAPASSAIWRPTDGWFKSTTFPNQIDQ
jgi:hypothetical protein